MRTLLAAAMAALLATISPPATGQTAPRSIDWLSAAGTAVPLPVRRPGDRNIATAVPATGYVQPLGATLDAPLQLVPTPGVVAAPPAAATQRQTAYVAPPTAPAASPKRGTAREAGPSRLDGAGLATFKTAVSAIQKGDVATADQLQGQIRDPIARSAIEWLIARSASGYGGAGRAMAFLDRHPGWPSRDTIRENIEASLFANPVGAETTIRYLRANAPVSGKGEIAFGRALIETGRRAEGLTRVRRGWYTEALSAGDEGRVLNEFGRLLDRDDHFRRAQGMLYRNRITAAQRMGKRLGANENRMINAWAQVIRRKNGAGSSLRAVSGGAARAPGHLFARIQHTRRSGDTVAAARLMPKGPRDPAALVDTGEWWIERRVLLRKLLDERQYQLAYRMAAEHASIEAKDIIEAEWHAGWVALSYRRKPRQAVRHFEGMARHVETPISVGRANYWLGRAYTASGNRGKGRKAYERAARHMTTYYGQLAAEELNRKRLDLGRIAKSNRAVDKLEPMRAATLFRQAGFNRYARSLVVGMSFYVDDAPSFARLAVLARDISGSHIAVNIAKRGMRAGHNVADEAYPLSVMPNRGRNSSGAPPPFVYAIARQESEFNRGAVSSAGARGLMQLMPATAKSVAREKGLRYSRAKLTSDPDYNMILGSAYLAKRLRNFSGSYIMAAAAYNAGKGRVDRWVETFGDPRSRSVDPIEWVERIPFSETRNYVMRVMENMQVYEARLSRNSAPLDLKRDLSKGR